MNDSISFFTRWFPKTEGNYGAAEPSVDPKDPLHTVRLRVEEWAEDDNGKMARWGNEFDIHLTPEQAEHLAGTLNEAATLSRHFSATITNEDITRNQNTYVVGNAQTYHEPKP